MLQKPIASYLLSVCLVVSNGKVNMIFLPLSWTEAQSSFNYVFGKKKKSPVHFQAFSPLSLIILNVLWATREVV